MLNRSMSIPTLLAAPTRVEAACNKSKLIDEYVGRINSNTSEASLAHMRSPGGWLEPGQTPVFDEFTVVLKGMIRVEYAGGMLDVRAGSRQSSPIEASGYATVPRKRSGRNTSQSAFPLFP